MLFKKFNSSYEKNVNISKYIINWEISPSKEQMRLQEFLKPFWKNKVILAEFRIPGSLFRVDILNISDRIGLEYSPSSSHDFNPFFHGDRLGFVRRVKSDLLKIKWLEDNNFRCVEINKEDLDYLSKSYFLNKFDINL